MNNTQRRVKRSLERALKRAELRDDPQAIASLCRALWTVGDAEASEPTPTVESAAVANEVDDWSWISLLTKQEQDIVADVIAAVDRLNQVKAVGMKRQQEVATLDGDRHSTTPVS